MCDEGTKRLLGFPLTDLPTSECAPYVSNVSQAYQGKEQMKIVCYLHVYQENEELSSPSRQGDVKSVQILASFHVPVPPSGEPFSEELVSDLFQRILSRYLVAPQFTMSGTNGVSKTLKILMLHGYTQNGPLFHAKTKALEKTLQKAFPGLSLSYPTGPMQLKPSDVPGINASALNGDEADAELYGWWRRSNTADPPEYVGIEDGLATVAKTMASEGPFDGVMGFSQGAALATMVASLLEGESRKEAFEKAQKKSDLAIAYPNSFTSLNHPPLKFCIAYSGFIAPDERYSAFYNPHIQTPMCHFIGSLDSVVEESRTQALVTAAGGSTKTQVVIHPGGHFVPNTRQYLDTVVAFVKAKISSLSTEPGAKEERVEDMDVPF